MNSNIDLHLHTNCSDGAYSPTEVVKWAAENGLREIAITDHDTVDGVMEAMDASIDYEILSHTGIEFSTEERHKIGLHILGYDINIHDEELEKVCQDLKDKRNLRNDKLIKALQKYYDITKEEILEINKESKDGYIGKPNIARALRYKGYIRDIDEAFKSVFARDEFRVIKKDKIETKKAFEIIKNAGGFIVLAHPGLIRGLGERNTKEFYDNFEKLIIELMTEGLQGIEAIYSKHSEEEKENFIAIAKKYGLIITRGSDFHG